MRRLNDQANERHRRDLKLNRFTNVTDRLTDNNLATNRRRNAGPAHMLFKRLADKKETTTKCPLLPAIPLAHDSHTLFNTARTIAYSATSSIACLDLHVFKPTSNLFKTHSQLILTLYITPTSDFVLQASHLAATRPNLNNIRPGSGRSVAQDARHAEQSKRLKFVSCVRGPSP